MFGGIDVVGVAALLLAIASLAWQVWDRWDYQQQLQDGTDDSDQSNGRRRVELPPTAVPMRAFQRENGRAPRWDDWHY